LIKSFESRDLAELFWLIYRETERIIKENRCSLPNNEKRVPTKDTPTLKSFFE